MNDRKDPTPVRATLDPRLALVPIRVLLAWLAQDQTPVSDRASAEMSQAAPAPAPAIARPERPASGQWAVSGDWTMPRRQTTLRQPNFKVTPALADVASVGWDFVIAAAPPLDLPPMAPPTSRLPQPEPPPPTPVSTKSPRAQLPPARPNSPPPVLRPAPRVFLEPAPGPAGERHANVRRIWPLRLGIGVGLAAVAVLAAAGFLLAWQAFSH